MIYAALCWVDNKWLTHCCQAFLKMSQKIFNISPDSFGTFCWYRILRSDHYTMDSGTPHLMVK